MNPEDMESKPSADK